MTQSAGTNPSGLARLARRTPIAVFLAGTFLWAWLFWGYWLPNMPATGLVITPAFVITAIIGGFAPSLAAVTTLWLAEGRPAAVRLLRGALAWRAKPMHYLFALGLVPAASLIALPLQRLLVGPTQPVDPSLIAVAAVWPIMAALGEEFGWRGFLYPRLLQRWGDIGAALVVGVIWGVWHLPADFVGLKGYGDWFWLAFLLNGPVVLTAHALIMAWIWRRSGGNLLLMLLYHWSITASAMLFPAAGVDTGAKLMATAIGCGVLWLVALALWVVEAVRPRVRPAASSPATSASA